MSPPGNKPPGAAGLLPLLKPYSGLIGFLLLLTILSSRLNLAVPRLISHAIDTFGKPGFALGPMVLQFAAVAIFIFAFTYGQSIVQTYASEKVARDLRARLVAKISVQTYGFVERASP